MGMVSEFFSSTAGHVVIAFIIIIVVLIVVGKLLFGRPIGQVIMEWLGRRPIHLDEIDAHAHERICDESKDAAKISKDRNATWLCLLAKDNVHYQSQMGIKSLGKIVGQATYQSFNIIWFRRPWRFKKYGFFAPPDMQLSSPSQKNVIYEGISIKMLANDFCYPVPPQGAKYSENYLDQFAVACYEYWNLMQSNVSLNPMGATMLLRSASDTAEVRMQMEAIKHHIYRSETDQPPNAGPPQQQDGGIL